METVKITREMHAHLNSLENEHGQITPAIVVNDAKRTDSPLHSLFDWDVESAAQRHWLDRARTIIRSVRVVVSHESHVIVAPYWVRDPSVPSTDQGYVSVVRLRTERERAQEALRREVNSAAGALTRARAVAAALGLEEDIDDMLARLVGLRSRLDVLLPPSTGDGEQPHA